MSTEAVIDEMTSQTEESVETASDTASDTAVQALEKPENPDAIIDLSTTLYSYQKDGK